MLEIRLLHEVTSDEGVKAGLEVNVNYSTACLVEELNRALKQNSVNYALRIGLALSYLFSVDFVIYKRRVAAE